MLKGKQVDQEESVKDAQDALNKAKFPPTKIAAGDSYLQGIRHAQERVDATQETLETTKESIAYWEGLLQEYSQSVDAEETK